MAIRVVVPRCAPDGVVDTIAIQGLTKADVLALRDNLQYTSRPRLQEIRELLEKALTEA